MIQRASYLFYRKDWICHCQEIRPGEFKYLPPGRKEVVKKLKDLGLNVYLAGHGKERWT
jgi:hypothetical protein